MAYERTARDPSFVQQPGKVRVAKRSPLWVECPDCEGMGLLPDTGNAEIAALFGPDVFADGELCQACGGTGFDGGFPVKGGLMAHQARTLYEAGLKMGHADWIDAGGGKTKTCIAEASLLFQLEAIDGMLVFAPMGPHSQWIDQQFPLWAEIDWRAIDVTMSRTEIERFFGRSFLGTLGVLAMNYDALRTSGGQKLLWRFRDRFRRNYVVFDESQKLKGDTAQRTKEARMIGHSASYRRVLSGTPILKGLQDLFTQYDIIDQGVTGFSRYGPYKQFYCVTKKSELNPKASYIVGYKNEAELLRRITPFTTRVDSSEFHDSDPVFATVRCPMKTEQRAIYAAMQEELVSIIDEQIQLAARKASGETLPPETKLITATNMLVQFGKLLQIASGYAIYTAGRDTSSHWFSDNKVDAVQDLLDDLDEPVVIFAPFVPLLDRLEEKIRARKDRPLFRYESRATVLEWEKTGGVILGNQGSGLGIGQNLQVAAATIYAANNFSSEARWHSLKRTDRIGQERQPRYWDLIAPGTRDERALESLAEKEDLASRTLSQLRAWLVEE